MVEYMIIYKDKLVNVLRPVGNMQEFLDMDIGLGPHHPTLEIMSNFREG